MPGLAPEHIQSEYAGPFVGLRVEELVTRLSSIEADLRNLAAETCALPPLRLFRNLDLLERQFDRLVSSLMLSAPMLLPMLLPIAALVLLGLPVVMALGIGLPLDLLDLLMRVGTIVILEEFTD